MHHPSATLFSLTSIPVQAAYFEQKFYATFFLAPEAAAPPSADSSQLQRKSERTRSADSRSPRLSPRDRSASNQGVHLAQEHPAAGVKEPVNSQQDKLATDRQGQPSHEPASVGGGQPAQGRSSRSSTPDLSPRGDPEADDPPTPRMYKSIVPTAAPSQPPQHHSDHSHSQRLQQISKAGNSQMILHQGHYDHGKRDISPPRQPHAHEGASQQVIEDLHHTIRQSFFALYILCVCACASVCICMCREKKKDYACWRRFNEKPRVIPGCSGYACVSLLQMQNGRRLTNMTCCLAQVVSRAKLLDAQIYCLPSILAHCLPEHCMASGIVRQSMSDCRDKDGVNASLESQLAAARYRITVDERAAKVPGTVDTAGMSLQSQSQVERLQVLNAQLEVS